MASYLADPAVDLRRALHALERFAAGDPLERLPITPAALYAAIRDHPELREPFELARMARATYAAERALTVGDPAQLDELDTYEDTKTGARRVDPGAVALRRLRTDTLWRYAQAMAPRLYGQAAAKADDQPQRGGLIIEDAQATLERLNTIENAAEGPNE